MSGVIEFKTCRKENCSRSEHKMVCPHNTRANCGQREAIPCCKQHYVRITPANGPSYLLLSIKIYE